MIYLHVFGV